MIIDYYVQKINEHYLVYKGIPRTFEDFNVRALNKSFSELEKIIKKDFDEGNKPMLYMNHENKFERIKFTELLKKYHHGTGKKD